MKTTKSTADRPRRGLRLAATVTIVLVLLGLAWSGYWMVLTRQLETGLHRWIAERQAEGYVVAYAGIARGGFPGAAEVIVTGPAISAPGDARGAVVPWAWSAARLVASVDPFDPRRLSLDIPGAQRLAVAEDAHYAVEAGQFTVMGKVGDQGAFLAARDLVLRPVLGTAAGEATLDSVGENVQAGTMTVAALEAEGRPAETADGGDLAASRHVRVRVADATLPAWLDVPLGRVVESLAAEATVRGELALAPWPEALLRWRDAGGVLDVTALEARYGPLAVTGNGTLALDTAGQPVGAFAARVSGLPQAIDMLRASGRMSQAEAAVARLAVGVLSGTPDRQAPLALPLTLQDRTLSIGPVRLMQFPEIVWLPAAAPSHP